MTEDDTVWVRYTDSEFWVEYMPPLGTDALYLWERMTAAQMSNLYREWSGYQ